MFLKPWPDGKCRCFQCGNVFNTINKMMIRRKKNHDKVKLCKNYLNNKCQRGELCWWDHEAGPNSIKESYQQSAQWPRTPMSKVWEGSLATKRGTESYQQSAQTEPNFWKTPRNQKPPDQIGNIVQEIIALILKMNQINNQMLNKLKT